MNDLAVWVGVGAAVLAVLVAWVTYRSQSTKKAIEYMVISSQRLVSPRVASELTVTFEGGVVADPSLTIIRMVSVGDRGIPASTFEGPLSISFCDAGDVVSTSVAAVRPSSLPAVLNIDSNRVLVEPLLLNPGDFLEIQALTNGQPREVLLDARISDVRLRRRSSLPYPPGSGLEGEMVGIDKFMWTVPEALVAICLYIVIVLSDLSLAAMLAWAVLVTIVFGVVYPLNLRRLIKRRRNWRP